MLRNLATDLLRNESIRTTTPKAMEVRRLAEHLISIAKKGDLLARRRVEKEIHDSQVLEKLFGALRTRYQSRSGGYVRVFATGNRSGDNAPMSLIKLVP
jgi:large subunit ribosomal protein L17